MSNPSSTSDTACSKQVQDLYEILRGLPAFRKIASRKLQTLSLDLTLVALGVRTGYLFDTFSFENRVSPLQVFGQVVHDLRKTLPSFRNVVVVTDPDHADYFFLNVPLLLNRLEQEDYPAFLSLEGQTQMLLPTIPQGVRVRLHELRQTVQSCRSGNETWSPSITVEALGHRDTPTDLVPLAGVLLEYPIAYAPAEAYQGQFLSDVDLQVFTCSLEGDVEDAESHARGTWPHTILQFSCPKSFAADVDAITDSLRCKLSARLSKIGWSRPLGISHRTERLHRVAL